MAAPARTRKRKTTIPPKATAAVSRPSRMLRGWHAFGRGGVAIFRSIRQIPIPDQIRREIVAVITLCSAGLLTLSIVGYVGKMTVVGVVGSALTWLAGRGAIFAPIALAWVATELLAETETAARRRRFVGLVFFSASIITFLDLIIVPSGRDAGGAIGQTLGDGARFVASDIGAGIVCFAFGLIGVYLLTGVHSRDIIDVWRRTRDARRARSEQRQAERQQAEVRRAEQRRAEASRVATLPMPAAQPELSVDDRVDAVPQRPVINVPKRQKAAPKPDELVAASVVAEAVASTEDLAPAPLPDLQKLILYESGSPDSLELEGKAELIQETLKNFKVDASVREIFPGPAVTLFALEPGPGTKVRRITELQNDLALALAARSIRIEAPVPGMARVGIELPNINIHTVGLRETIESIEFQSTKARIPLALGRDVNGSYIVADLARMPHLLIAGSTGSGKSVCINGIISTFLLNRRPEELQMVMIDPKMVELTGFNGVPHLKCPVVTEMGKVVGTLRLVLKEMEDRYQRFSMLGVRNIDGYNLRREEDPSLERMSYIVVIIDELADLMLTTPEEVETLLVRLAQMARATGIHLMIATQRPSVDVLTGLIKANVPARIAFAVTSHTDSRVILDMPGAERLLGRGDMLFLPPDEAKPQRVQGSFIDDKDIQFLVRHWRKMAPAHEFDQEWADVRSTEDGEDEGDDPLMDQALRVVKQQGTASASMLQRRLRIGYNRAARLIEQMEEEGVVGPADGSRGRPVYLSDDVD
ncbi:MAG TPA: DNA translocase FtsK 4TM domain-containing protein [Nitrolancea sp.]|nr:DNA translocase FtsK 4TM domain-containing protein [Nitrolancea sp.]